jgi:chemotaxis receptor (MCP) glutamine deamidase CheD
MSVGEQNLLDARAKLPSKGLQVINVSTGIDKGRPLGLGTDHQRTVLLKGSNRNHLYLHSPAL